MKNSNFPSWNNIHTLIFDFDGVFTDNKVFINQEGVKKAIKDFDIDLSKGFQTQSGQLILFN